MATDRGGLLDVESGEVPARGIWDLSAWIGIADDPLVLRSEDGTQVSSLVHRRVGGEVGLNYSLTNWLGLAVDLPFVANQADGANTLLAGDVDTFGIGDVKLSPKVELIRGISIMPTVILPTASSTDFFGRGALVLEPELAMQFRMGRVRVLLNGAVRWSKQKAVLADLAIDNELVLRAGLGLALTKRVELGVTSHASTALKEPFTDKNQQAVEVFGGLQAVVASRFRVFAGGGAGVARGYGSPDWRALLGVRIGAGGAPAARAPGDRDRDGIMDSDDACPDDPENKDGIDDADGCPEKAVTDGDQDGDGIRDSVDKCPSDAEDNDSFEDDDGCPDPDNDGDGVLDVDDRCVNEAGVRENRGCPDTDRDGDNVVDRLDNCPDEPGTPKYKGCKKKQLVALDDGKIAILDKVFFKTNKATILKKSFPLLNNVASVINAHPDAGVVVIEGHTDDRGDDDSNMSLSQARAESVMAYLIKRGVPEERLRAQGFGETKPIADNGSNAGRSANRRVEFVLQNSSGIEQRNSGPSRESMD